MRSIFVIFISFWIVFTQAQNTLLQSGPMLGPITLRDATIWVQTKQVTFVQIEYKIKGSSDSFQESAPVIADASNHFMVSIHLINLVPGTNYEYKVKIKNEYLSLSYPLEFRTQEHWQFRKEAPDFSFTAGSCFYVNDVTYDRPGKPYGGEYEIIKVISNTRPDFMLWLGDNTYLREGDYESKSGIYYRQSHTRSLPELQPLLAQVPHYAIWDDHDYGPNDSDWTYPLKGHALEAFKNFWPSEAYGAGHTDGVTSSFVWNDCQFFMLDNRWYRTVQKENGTILGDIQKYWLKEALLASTASFKFVAVGGQFLSDYAAFENFANYKDERQELIDFIDEHKIKNVVFLTGDRHHSEISHLVTPNGIKIYDITSSALTSTTYDHTKEPNTHRIPGSMISERNFAVFKVTGERKDRKLSVVFKNTQGKDVYSYSF
jgi:alkaline phosphatase D